MDDLIVRLVGVVVLGRLLVAVLVVGRLDGRGRVGRGGSSSSGVGVGASGGRDRHGGLARGRCGRLGQGGVARLLVEVDAVADAVALLGLEVRARAALLARGAPLVALAGEALRDIDAGLVDGGVEAADAAGGLVEL